MSAYLVFPLILSASSAILLAIVLTLAHPKKVVNRLFALYLVTLTAYGVLIYLMRSSPDLRTAYEWEMRLVGLGFFLSVFLCHFCIAFSGARINRWVLIGMYVIAGVFNLPVVLSLVIQGMQVRPYGYAPVFGPLSPVWFVFLFGLGIWGTVLLGIRRRRYSSPEQRNRFNYIIAGLVLSMVGGFFDVLPTYGLPLYPGSIIGFIVFCILTALAIVIHHLLDIRIVLRRGSAYLILSVAVALPYAGAIIGINYFLSQTVERMVLYVVVLIGGAVAFQPLWRWAQDAVDRMFYRGRYDYLQTLDALTHKTYGLDQMPGLGKSVTELMRGALGAGNCHLLLLGPQGFRCLEDADERHPTMGLPGDHPVVLWLQNHPGVLRHDELQFFPQLQALTLVQFQDLSNLKARLYVPVKTGEGRLVAILTVGDKNSRVPYSLEEENIVLDTAGHLTVNMENAYLYSQEKSLREDLEKETQNRTEFLVAAAHEMRTPLTSIMASAELLSDEVPKTQGDPRSELVDNIRVAADTLHRRTSELLDFGRMRNSRIEVHPEPLNLGRLVQQTARQLDPLLKQKGQQWAMDLQEPLPMVTADPTRIEQVLINLMGNASKFSPHDTLLKASIRQQAGQTIVSVTDAAIPLSDREREKLFQPYYLGDNPRRHATGLGLGLAISRHLIERHGGKIWVESNESGNTFTFSLPVIDLKGKPVQAEDREPNNGTSIPPSPDELQGNAPASGTKTGPG